MKISRNIRACTLLKSPLLVDSLLLLIGPLRFLSNRSESLFGAVSDQVSETFELRITNKVVFAVWTIYLERI
jgi:hypothetical protein